MRIKRIDLIEKYIFQQKSVSLDTLCEKFSVSKNTIRRDIETLAEKGTIKKVYGGVTVVEDAKTIQKVIPYEERNTVYASEKDLICQKAASFVEDHDIIYIDTGTTCLNLVNYISSKTCTIITNSLQVYIQAIPYANLNVISLPGRLKRETLSFVGSEIVDYLKTYNISKAFMACTGITIENGLTNATTEEYIVKKAAIENSKTRFILADHSKFGHFSLMTYCNLADIQHIITDTELPDDYKKYCELYDIGIHMPE